MLAFVNHCSGRSVRGINLLNAIYHSHGASIPVAFELVKKPIQYCDIATKKLKRKSEITKNLFDARDDRDLPAKRAEVSLLSDGQLVCLAGEL